MEKSKRYKRRLWLTTALLLGAALIGLVGVDIRSGAATPVADPTGDVVAAGDSLGGSMLPALVKMISALVVVVIAIYGCVYGLKRLAGSRGRRPGEQRLLEVIETTYVAPKKTVSLVRVADKAVLIGVTESQISMLTELNAEQTAAVTARLEEKPAAGPSFSRMLSSASDQFRRLGAGKKEAVLDT